MSPETQPTNRHGVSKPKAETPVIGGSEKRKWRRDLPKICGGIILFNIYDALYHYCYAHDIIDLLRAQWFWETLAVSVVLGGIVFILVFNHHKRKKAEASLHHIHEKLEETIRERTAALVETNRKLETEIIERKEIEKKHLTHLEYLQNIEEISHIINKSSDVEQMIHDVIEAVFRIFDSDRAWLLYPLDPETSFWKVPVEYCRPEFIETSARNQYYPMNPHIKKLMESVLHTDAPVTYGPGNAYKIPEGVEVFSVRSLMMTPLRPKVGQPWIMGLHQCSYDRMWSPDEQKLYKDIGYRVTEALGNFLFFRNLKDSESILRSVTSAVPGLVYRVRFLKNATAEFVYLSEGLKTLFELEPGDVLKEPEQLIRSIHPDDLPSVKLTIAKAYREKTGWITEYRIITHAGKHKWLNDHAVCQKQSDGGYVWNGVCLDNTEQKKIELHFRQSRKMEAIGNLAGGIAHDFNNLLMGIQGNISLILLTLDKKHPNYERLLSIEKAIQHGSELTHRLLGFAKGRQFELKVKNLNEIIKDQNKMFGRTRKEIRIIEQLASDLWHVEIDESQIQQVILNLFINAWHAMPGGGRLYTLTENCILDEADVKPFHLNPGKYVKMSVTDTGIGMTSEILQKIFEPFFTTREDGKGAGMGLASAYSIMKNHYGFINVYSEKDVGTTFNLYFPASDKTMAQEAKQADTLVMGQGTILLVDDEEIILDVGKQMIEKLGYTVLSARNGRDAIEIYKEKAKEIDLVILDMIMPVIGGKETYEILKDIDPGVKVLLSSGYSINGQAAEIIRSGCNGFIQKPFNLERLSIKMKDVIQHR